MKALASVVALVGVAILCGGSGGGCGGPNGGGTGTGTSGGSTGGGGTTGGGSCQPLSGTWTVQSIDCPTAANPSAYAVDYTSPNSISFDFTSATALVETNTTNGCSVAIPNSLVYTGACAFTGTPDGLNTCTPSATCSSICGQEGTSVTTWTYSQNGNALTMSMTNIDPGTCPANVETVITLTQ
jgi:hypothetical protein